MDYITRKIGMSENASVLRAVIDAVKNSPCISGTPQAIELVTTDFEPIHISISADAKYIVAVEAAIPLARNIFDDKNNAGLTPAYGPAELLTEMSNVVVTHLEHNLGSVAYRAGIAVREVFRDAL